MSEPIAPIDVAVIDVDSHLTEPVDLWTSRLPDRFQEQAPHVVFDEGMGRDRWVIGDHRVLGVQDQAHAGWKEFFPSTPPSFEQADPAGWDPRARLKVMDAHGISAQILYPNLLGFFPWAFMSLDREASLACVRAFNDFQIEWCAEDPERLIPLAFLPFWDVDESVRELRRAANMGYKGFNWGHKLEQVGLPPLADKHWDPVMNLAQELDMPVSLHIGFGGSNRDTDQDHLEELFADDIGIAQMGVLFFIGNATAISDLCMRGVCERFPRLKFVSAESGFGYVPFLLEAMDWQYKNNRASLRQGDRLLPSEYFRRQVYATFWFEAHVDRLIDLLPDNVMFESDFPHPTSLSPGPASCADDAKTTIAKNLAGLADDVRRKVLHDTAARVYHLEV